MTIKTPRYFLCKRLSLELLLNQQLTSCIIDARFLKYKQNIVFSSFQNYCNKTGIDFSDITINSKLSDGYTIKINDTYLILYDENVTVQRLRFSMAHEIGHVLLNHKDDSNVEETEANCFASHLLIPDCILYSAMHKNYKYDLVATHNSFGVSWDVANYKLKKLYKFDQFYYNDNEKLLLDKYVNSFVTKNVDSLV